MAGSFQGYRNSVLAGLGDQNAQQAILSETPGFNMFSNVNTSNVPGMDILSPTERQNQEYDQNAMRAEALNKEVEIGLGTRVDDVMSDAEKQYYLNHLTKSQYEQMLKYKNEGYGFMASKALMENSYKLADPNATGLMKYKDYAQKDAYYNNSLLMPGEAVTTPTQQLADWWNERYSKNVTYGTKENGEMYVIRDDNNFWNRLANVSFGSLVNLFNTGVNGMMNIMDKGQSALWSALDKAILGIDTDSKFYRQSDTTLINDVAQTVGSAASLAALGLGVAGSPLGMAGITTLSATKPGGFLMDLTFGNLNKLVNRTLDKIDFKDYLNQQSLDSVSNAITLGITIGLAKVGGPKIQNSKIGAYSNTIKGMVKDGLQKGTEYAKVQADYENFAGTKKYSYIDGETGETGEFTTFEGYNPGYRGRVAKSFWEGFKEGVKDRFNNPNGTNLSERRNTTWQEGLQGTEPGADGSNKTATDSTQNNGKVNTFGAAQLRQWNKMNKNQGIKFANRYGTDYGTWMAQRGFNQGYDTNIQQLISYDEYMQQQKRNALSAVKQRYQDPDVLDMLNEAIERADYTKSEDLPRLLNLKKKYENGGLEMVDEDYIRQWFGYHFPLKFDGTDVAGVTQRNNNMYERVKNVLERQAEENGIPQLREINREIAATYHIIDGTTRYYNGVATNDVMSLKDLITLASTVANPKARPIFVIQQSLKMPKVRDTILSKLIKGKTNEERTQIKIDFDKIRKIQDEAEQRRLLEEWIAKWNLKVEEATKAMQNRLPENITQGGVVAGDRGIVSTNPSSPTYQQMGLGTIRETASPQYLLRAIIEQLKESNLIKDIDTAEAINQILSNMSPEAQATLAEITRKLANGQPLTEKEGKIIEKIADIIRQDQDGIDNQEPTDINNTNLPTNPTNNGGSTEGGNPGEGGLGELSGGETTGKAKANDGTNGGGDKGGSGEGVNQLGTPKSTDGVGEEIIEIGDVNDAYQLIDNLLGNSKYSLSSPSERGGYRTFTNSNRDAAISIDSDGNIVEFVQSENAPKGAADELLLHAIEQGANKIDVDYNSIGLINKLQKFGFYALSRAGYGASTKYYLAHNGDVVDTIRQRMGGYDLDDRLGIRKRFDTYEEAAKYRDEFIKDNTGYELTDEKGWDGLKNYKEFNKNFKTKADIKKYVDDTFKGIDSHVANDVEELFNKTLAMTRQAYNGNKDTRDLSIVYALLSEFPENVVGRYWRPTNTLKSAKEGFTFFHEFIHYSDYFGGKELTGSEVELSTIANQIKNRKRPKNIDTRAELIWDFAEIFKEIDKWAWHGKDVRNNKGYTEDVWEIFARWGEAFYSDIQGKGLISMDGEMFPRKISTMFAKWLGKMNIARANGELYDGTLQEISKRRRKGVTLSIPGVGNVRGMKIGILKDGKTVGLKGAEEFENSDRRGYHGSPAKFDKFDSTHMGEGEGGQAHGWGHYIAIEERTGRHYAEMGKAGYEYDGTSLEKYRKDHQYMPFDERDAKSVAEEMVLNDMILNGNPDINELKDEVKIAIHNAQYKSIRDKYEEVLDALDTIDLEKIKKIPGKHFYEVEIPDPIEKDTPTGSNYWEEDINLTEEQLDKIYKELGKINKYGEEYLRSVTDYDFERGWKVDGKYIYQKLSDRLGGPRMASEFLKNLGYDGIHYYGGRDGEAYVIFDNDAIEIKNHESY